MNIIENLRLIINDKIRKFFVISKVNLNEFIRILMKNRRNSTFLMLFPLIFT